MNEPGYSLHDTTLPALDRMRAHASAYEVAVDGVTLVVLPGVWSPAYDWSGRFHVENLPDVRGRDVLEVGCGCGVISVFAALRGARSVVATDINPQAVENTRLNLERQELAGASALVSNLFSAIDGAFDVVIWNAPYHGVTPSDMLERACADADYRSLRAFFAGVSAHLRAGGLVQLGFSSSGDIDLLEKLIAQHGFVVRRRVVDVREGYECEVFDLAIEGAGA